MGGAKEDKEEEEEEVRAKDRCVLIRRVHRLDLDNPPKRPLRAATVETLKLLFIVPT